VYVTDGIENRVRRVDTDGVISTVIGTGPAGTSGDNGPAIEAPLADPVGIGFDSEGRMLIGEQYSGRLRRVDADGIITTIAGFGGTLPGIQDIAVSKKDLILTTQITDSSVRGVLPDGTVSLFAGNQTTADGGDGGPPLDAAMNQPVGIAILDGKGVAIADQGNNRIRFVDVNVGDTGQIDTIAGDGFVRQCDAIPIDGSPVAALEAALSTPFGIAYGPDGTLFVTSNISHSVFSVRDGQVRRIGGNCQQSSRGDGGSALEASFDQPTGVVVGGDGTVYVAEQGAHVVRAIARDGTISTVAGSRQPGFAGDGGPAIDAQLNAPTHLEIGLDGALYIADTANNRIRRVDLDSGIITTVAGAF
jgi:hypothetical protein